MDRSPKQAIGGRPAGRLAITTILLASIVMLGGGCRSSGWTSPSWNSFGFKREPSADTLAGMGPTTTYPVSPSAGATPNPIQSVAASPAGAQPQTQLAARPNSAAAAANGFPSGTAPTAAPAATSAGGAAPTYASTSPAAGSSPAASPPSAASPSAATASAAPSTAPSPAHSPYTTVGYPMPGSASSMPNPASAGTTPSSGGPSVPSTSGTPHATPPSAVAGGFTLPSDIQMAPTPTDDASFAMPGGVAQSPAAPSAPSSASSSAGGFVMPPLPGMAPTAAEPAVASGPAAATEPAAAKGPAAQVATLPTGASQAPPAVGTVVPAGGGYTPGSTAGANDYPAATVSGGEDGGAFYR